MSGPYFDRELADTLQAARRRAGSVSEIVEGARRTRPDRFERVRAACGGGAWYVDLDVHAARIVLTLHEREASQ